MNGFFALSHTFSSGHYGCAVCLLDREAADTNGGNMYLKIA